MTEPEDAPRQLPQTDPFADPIQQMDGAGSRRLVSFTFTCPICRDEHSPEFYFTIPAQDPDQYAQAMAVFMESEKSLELALKVTAQLHIEDHNLVEKLIALEQDRPECRITGYEILEESEYSCDFCSETFPTIAGLRLHLGVSAETAPDHDTVRPICQMHLDAAL